MSQALRRLRNTVRFTVADSDRLAPLLALTDDQTRHIGVTRLARSAVDLVVDGFPGSGNTFARWAFEVAQPEPITVGGKVHSPALLRRAVAAGVPTVLVIRPPADVAVSTVARWPWMELQTQLSRWIRFHTALDHHTDGMVVAPFATVIGEFRVVVEAVNHRFGTDFALDPERWAAPDPVVGRSTSEERASRRAELANMLAADKDLVALLDEAKSVYATFVGARTEVR